MTFGSCSQLRAVDLPSIFFYIVRILRWGSYCPLRGNDTWRKISMRKTNIVPWTEEWEMLYSLEEEL